MYLNASSVGLGMIKRIPQDHVSRVLRVERSIEVGLDNRPDEMIVLGRN